MVRVPRYLDPSNDWIPWWKCPEKVRPIEMALYELSRLYLIQKKRAQGYKNFYSKVCRAQDFPCQHTESIAEASEKGKEKLAELMEPHLKRHPVYRYYLSKLPGVGVVLAGLVLGNIHPWRFPTVSKLYAWAGLAPDDYYIKKCGHTECYHKKAKYIVFAVARSLVQNMRFYRSLFEERLEIEIRKLREENPNRPIDKIEDHAIMRSYRYVAKIWVSQYYEAYSMILDIPYRPPYVVFAGVRDIYYPPVIRHGAREIPLDMILKKTRA